MIARTHAENFLQRREPRDYSMGSCMSVDSFKNNISKYLREASDVSRYIERYSTYAGRRLNKLGKGAFGVVYEVSLLPNIENEQGAFKVITYDNREMFLLKKEINFFKNVAPKYPLFFLKYYNCVIDNFNNRLMIFTEKLDRSLHVAPDRSNWLYKKEKNRKLFRVVKDKPLSVKIGLLLNMALGISLIHKEGYIHYDIKPENFLIKDGEYPIIKIIDYGIVHDFKRSREVIENIGTPYYMDPNIASYRPKNSIENDIYSLGITFIEIFFNVFFGFQESRALDVASIINLFSNKRIKNYQDCLLPNNYTIKNCELPDEMIRYPTEEKVLKKLFISMIDFDIKERPSSEEVVITLYYILKSIDPDSIYLPENENKLYRKAYGDINSKEYPKITSSSNANPVEKLDLEYLEKINIKKFNLHEYIKDFVLNKINEQERLEEDHEAAKPANEDNKHSFILEKENKNNNIDNFKVDHVLEKKDRLERRKYIAEPQDYKLQQNPIRQRDKREIIQNPINKNRLYNYKRPDQHINEKRNLPKYDIKAVADKDGKNFIDNVRDKKDILPRYLYDELIKKRDERMNRLYRESAQRKVRNERRMYDRPKQLYPRHQNNAYNESIRKKYRYPANKGRYPNDDFYGMAKQPIRYI